MIWAIFGPFSFQFYDLLFLSLFYCQRKHKTFNYPLQLLVSTLMIFFTFSGPQTCSNSLNLSDHFKHLNVLQNTHKLKNKQPAQACA